MQALAAGTLPAGGRLGFHLDRCLDCRACERVCPAGVPYGHLIDAARALGRQQRRSHWLRDFMFDQVIPRPRAMARLASVLRIYQRSGLRRLARATGVLRAAGLDRLETALPDLAKPATLEERYPPLGEARGRVALFTGCTGTVLDQPALRGAIRLLTALGYEVHIPQEQTCCGALHLHDGDIGKAADLAARNAAAFNAASFDAVVYVASGCGATLLEYANWPPAQRSAAIRAPVTDVCSFVEAAKWPEHLTLRPLNIRVAVHDPCTLANVARAAEAPHRLLRRIPGLEVIALPGNRACCGAAGTYFLSQPDMADSLRDDKVRAIESSGASLLATSNIGCALHLAAGARRSGLAIEVLHPITLLSEQLDESVKIKPNTPFVSSPSTSASSASSPVRAAARRPP